VYTLLKVLRYSDVNGTEDRDDTMLVARLDHEKSSTHWFNIGHPELGENGKSEIVATVFQNQVDRPFLEHGRHMV
jgi:hypothetical protein